MSNKKDLFLFQTSNIDLSEEKLLNKKTSRANKDNNDKSFTDKDRSKQFNGNKYKAGRWKKDEHIRFIKGCFLFKNNWKKVKDIVKTRSSSQIRSHAQKYIIKLCKKYKIEEEKLTLNGFNLANELEIEPIRNSSNVSVQNLEKIILTIFKSDILGAQQIIGDVDLDSLYFPNDFNDSDYDESIEEKIKPVSIHKDDKISLENDENIKNKKNSKFNQFDEFFRDGKFDIFNKNLSLLNKLKNIDIPGINQLNDQEKNFLLMLFDPNYFKNLTDYMDSILNICQKNNDLNPSLKEDDWNLLNKNKIDIPHVSKEKEYECLNDKEKEDLDELSKFEDHFEINLDEYTQNNSIFNKSNNDKEIKENKEKNINEVIKIEDKEIHKAISIESEMKNDFINSLFSDTHEKFLNIIKEDNIYIKTKKQHFNFEDTKISSQQLNSCKEQENIKKLEKFVNDNYKNQLISDENYENKFLNFSKSLCYFQSYFPNLPLNNNETFINDINNYYNYFSENNDLNINKIFDEKNTNFFNDNKNNNFQISEKTHPNSKKLFSSTNQSTYIVNNNYNTFSNVIDEYPNKINNFNYASLNFMNDNNFLPKFQDEFNLNKSFPSYNNVVKFEIPKFEESPDYKEEIIGLKKDNGVVYENHDSNNNYIKKNDLNNDFLNKGLEKTNLMYKNNLLDLKEENNTFSGFLDCNKICQLLNQEIRENNHVDTNNNIDINKINKEADHFNQGFVYENNNFINEINLLNLLKNKNFDFLLNQSSLEKSIYSNLNIPSNDIVKLEGKNYDENDLNDELKNMFWGTIANQLIENKNLCDYLSTSTLNKLMDDCKLKTIVDNQCSLNQLENLTEKNKLINYDTLQNPEVNLNSNNDEAEKDLKNLEEVNLECQEQTIISNQHNEEKLLINDLILLKNLEFPTNFSYNKRDTIRNEFEIDKLNFNNFTSSNKNLNENSQRKKIDYLINNSFCTNDHPINIRYENFKANENS